MPRPRFAPAALVTPTAVVRAATPNARAGFTKPDNAK
jgi:hypothetical protein